LTGGWQARTISCGREAAGGGLEPTNCAAMAQTFNEKTENFTGWQEESTCASWWLTTTF
jgi:hypothetical protein